MNPPSNDRSDADEWDELRDAAGSALRVTARFVGRSIHRAEALIRDTRKAFEQGRDPNIEDARIVDERDRNSEGNGPDV